MDDVDPIAETMRPMDAFECHCGGHSPYEALELALENDTCTFTIVDKFDHTPLAMFGCGESDYSPYIWALASDLLVPRAGRDFIRHSPEWINGMLKAIGGKASNYVYSENTDAIRWLKHCGAEFEDQIYSINNQPFVKFAIKTYTTEQVKIEDLTVFDSISFNGDPDNCINNIEKCLVEHPQANCPVTHRFTTGMYIREISVPKGTLFTSMKHKTEHPLVLTKGKIAVISENENSVIYTAPLTVITKPKTRRVVYALEDTIWTTFHVTDKTDIEEIGKDILEEHNNSLIDKDDPRINQWKNQLLNIQ